METKWRIPSLTRADGQVIKAWQPRELDYKTAELAMELFNEKNIVGALKTKLKSTSGVMLVLRDDGGSKDDNMNMLELLKETHPIETQGVEKEIDDFMKEVLKHKNW